MIDTGTLDTQLKERKREARELEAKAENARRLGSTIEDLRRDVERLETKRDRFRAVGKNHVESAVESYDQRYGSMIRWEPIKSVLTGDELAAQVDTNIEHLRAEIARLEQEIGQLLASVGSR